MRNLHLLYNKLYYQPIPGVEKPIKERNREIFRTEFDPERDRIDSLDSVPGICKCSMEVVYPGLLIGLGVLHSSGLSRDEIKMGFTFDYVSGQPILPGSSLKGMLRSVFREHPELICALLNLPAEQEQDKEASVSWVKMLEQSIFDGQDVFFDAVVERGDREGKLMAQDCITPNRGPYKKQYPIYMLKVRPGVRFAFRFLLEDSRDGDQLLLTAAEKLALFRQLISLMGVGGGTNVGYGHLQEIQSM